MRRRLQPGDVVLTMGGFIATRESFAAPPKIVEADSTLVVVRAQRCTLSTDHTAQFQENVIRLLLLMTDGSLVFKETLQEAVDELLTAM